MPSLAELRADALACHAAALAAVEAGGLVGRCLVRERGSLALRDRAGRIVAEHRGPVLIVGGGKAGLAMARAAAGIAAADCRGGVVVVPHGGEGSCAGGVAVAGGGHPLPDAQGAAATRRVLDAVAGVDGRTLIIAVLSGGGSALLVTPAPGLRREDKVGITRALLASGADIVGVNTVRKHCSRVKGGGLLRAAAGASAVWTLVLSDAPDDDPATIASGPTVADPTTFAEAEAVLATYLEVGDVPAAIRRHLARGAAGAIPETVKPGDPLLGRAVTIVVGGNADAVAAAAELARTRGYATELLRERLSGDAADAGRMLAARLRDAPRDRPVALVAGGETTVTVRGGQGGRCQHLALAAAIALGGEPAVLLAAGTDGIDGPTDAAGACVDGGTAARAHALGLDPAATLASTDSHGLLAATGDLVRAGPTGTNVADVVVALRPAC